MGEPESVASTLPDASSRLTTAKLMVSVGRVASASGGATLLLAATAVITARSLGPGGRGVIVLVSTAATYLMLATSVGIPISGRVMLGQADRRRVLVQYLGLSLLLLIGQLVLAAIVVPLILVHSGVPVTLGQAAIASLYAGCLMGAYLLLHALYGVGMNEHAASVQVGGALIQVALVSALAVLGVVSPWPYVGALIGGTVGQICVSIGVLARAGLLVRPGLQKTIVLELLRRGLPGIGLLFGQSATLRIDRILIGLFLTAGPVGIYSVAATGTETVWLVPTALSQVLFHRFASKSVDLSTAARARLVSLAIAVATAATIFLVAPIAIDVLVGPRFADAVLPLRILLIGAVFLASYQLDSYALAGRGLVGRAAIATLIGFVVVLAADLLLIPTYGIVGAAWASVIAYASMAGIVWVMARRIESRTTTATIEHRKENQ